MSETLGSLLDKLSVLKIRQWHTDDDDTTFVRLEEQECLLEDEIDKFIDGALKGSIPHALLTHPAFKTGVNGSPSVYASIAANFSKLTEVNCDIWHDVEKSRLPKDSMPSDQWYTLVQRLAYLNLQRNGCKEAIDRQFSELCKS